MAALSLRFDSHQSKAQRKVIRGLDLIVQLVCQIRARGERVVRDVILENLLLDRRAGSLLRCGLGDATSLDAYTHPSAMDPSILHPRHRLTVLLRRRLRRSSLPWTHRARCRRRLALCLRHELLRDLLGLAHKVLYSVVGRFAAVETRDFLAVHL